jgi:hypothetical protein
MLPPILSEIERHTESVLTGSYCGRTETCRACNAPGPFGLHGVRRRTFLATESSWVHAVQSWVCRYRCERCRATFTDYPVFAIPRKRYVVAAIVSGASAYLDDDEATYRGAIATAAGTPTFYAGAEAAGGDPDDDAPRIDDRSLAHTTLWRWMAALAAMPRTVGAAKQLLSETAARFALRVIAPKKARSKARRAVLCTAAELLDAEALLRAERNESIFTGLAPRVHFG